ncbi:MAG: class I SAM-dependent methyltransferase [Candidatus Accumulibacter sp.]|uniref:SAM-dependent methyltransferase n=1 Tax=Accumulibacter sp. TaxID=2053492 RepID=UPI0025D8E593|nr:cyclopropane-fatty-acyl-phospholipid synthase family protein [Accumulibacter sp.]MCP5249876.1 class I SAM-dependent methyltransferase [Accumulibacter sp.]
MGQQQTNPASNPVSGQSGDERAIVRPARPALDAAVSALAAVLLKRVLESIGNPGLRFVLWNGDEIPRHRDAKSGRILIHDMAALLRLVANPAMNFGEMYASRRIDVQGDLPELLEQVYRALPREDGVTDKRLRLGAWLDAQRHSLRQARNNIRHHYDFGNDFYKLWLDREMIYTCAYFPAPAIDLESAQRAKMQHICRKLRLKPGEKVIEAGCGWGAMALHMARQHGVSVQAYNISREQISFARERARQEGFGAQVEFIEDDYRNARGKFDAFVSVGMLEHVGPERYEELGHLIDGVLADHGRGLIHSIGRDYPQALNAWTERRIFPAACPPSLSQMMNIFEPCGFSVLDVENLRLHYAKTLEHWLQRFEANAAAVEAMFDPTVARTWRLYLAGSLAAFRAGNMQLFQVLFARSRDNRIPWTRDAP